MPEETWRPLKPAGTIPGIMYSSCKMYRKLCWWLSAFQTNFICSTNTHIQAYKVFRDWCTLEYRPLYYWRYVDIFILFKSSDQLKRFQSYLNSCHVNISLTKKLNRKTKHHSLRPLFFANRINLQDSVENF